MIKGNDILKNNLSTVGSMVSLSLTSTQHNVILCVVFLTPIVITMSVIMLKFVAPPSIPPVCRHGGNNTDTREHLLKGKAKYTSSLR